MKKKQKTKKKLSLEKLQVAKITFGLNSIKGGNTLKVNRTTFGDKTTGTGDETISIFTI